MCNAEISRLQEESKELLSSLQEKEDAATQLQKKRQQVPEQLELLKLMTQMDKLEHRLQEAEYEKQQVELEKEAIMKEIETRENLKTQLHAQLGKL